MTDEPLPEDDTRLNQPHQHDPTEPELVERLIRRRPGVMIPIGQSLLLTVRTLGDVVLTDGNRLLELGPGKWRIVEEDTYRRVMKAALTQPVQGDKPT